MAAAVAADVVVVVVYAVAASAEVVAFAAVVDVVAPVVIGVVAVVIDVAFAEVVAIGVVSSAVVSAAPLVSAWRQLLFDLFKVVRSIDLGRNVFEGFGVEIVNNCRDKRPMGRVSSEVDPFKGLNVSEFV